jgi:DNA-binding CsgD family transcriptional regulator
MALHFRSDLVGAVRLVQIEAVDCDPDLVERRRRFMHAIAPEMVPRLFRPGVGTFREQTAGMANADGLFRAAYGDTGMRDALAAVAMDPDGQGVLLIAGLPEVTRPAARERERLWRLTVHLAAGARLRRGLAKLTGPDAEAAEGAASDATVHASPLPLQGEAVLDADTGRVVEALEPAQTATARRHLRQAALAMERARTPGRTDPEQALALWRGLVAGRWSLVDHFDSDGRRFFIARPNPPQVKQGRGLTPLEERAVAFATVGESNKAIGYRLGLSSQAVSATLAVAQRKLGVANRAELIRKLAPLLPALRSDA